jgi:hypothetical protein
VARLHGAKSKSNINSLLHVLHLSIMHSCWRKKSTHPLAMVHYCKRGGKNPHTPHPWVKKDTSCKVHVQPFHWLHTNSIPKTICHHFWLELLTLAKSKCTCLWFILISSWVCAHTSFFQKGDILIGPSPIFLKGTSQ